MSKTRLILLVGMVALLFVASAGFVMLNRQATADYNASSTAIVERQIYALATARASTPKP